MKKTSASDRRSDSTRGSSFICGFTQKHRVVATIVSSGSRAHFTCRGLIGTMHECHSNSLPSGLTNFPANQHGASVQSIDTGMHRLRRRQQLNVDEALANLALKAPRTRSEER